MAAVGLDADTKLLGSPAHHKQSMCQYPSYIRLGGASYGRWSTLCSRDHLAANHPDTTMFATAWVASIPNGPKLCARSRRHQSDAFTMLLADPSL